MLVRPAAQGGFHQGLVELAQDTVQRRGAGGLVVGEAQGTHELLAVTTAPVGDRTVTPVTTPHGHTHARENRG